MEDEKKEAIEGEVVEETKEEKKEGKLKQFWNKTKQNLNDQMLEGKIRSAFEKANAKFTVYTNDKVFSTTEFGFVKDGALTYFGEDEIKPYSVIIDKDKKAYYALETTDATCKSTVEGVEYERPGKCVKLDENVEEVKVVKCGYRYFLYKGTE